MVAAQRRDADDQVRLTRIPVPEQDPLPCRQARRGFEGANDTVAATERPIGPRPPLRWPSLS